MSEALRKVEGIKRLPVFPLPLVLLPFELLPLHIFEPRYKKMLEHARSTHNLLGISLFDPDETPEDRPVEGSLGCAGEIREAHKEEDGRSNILAVGLIRYEIERYIDRGEPYLVAEVSFFEDETETTDLQPLADEVFALFRRVAKAAHSLSGQQGDFPDMPQAEPRQLSFLVSAAFNLQNQIKYQMLEFRKTSERLEKLKEILSQTVGQVEETARINKVSRKNGHLKKKIDLP